MAAFGEGENWKKDLVAPEKDTRVQTAVCAHGFREHVYAFLLFIYMSIILARF